MFEQSKDNLTSVIQMRQKSNFYETQTLDMGLNNCYTEK